MGTDASVSPSSESQSPGNPGSTEEELAAGEPEPMRASDDERHRTADVLGEHAAAGRLTLAELEDRTARAYAATTREELTTLLRDLPSTTPEHEQELATPPTTHVPESSQRERKSRRKGTRWFFAFMSGSNWRGRRRLRGTVNVVTVMGGDNIDLREAEIEGEELVVNLVSLIGGPAIYVPDTIDVEMSGPAIIGGNNERGSARTPRPGAPVIRMRSFALMGGVELWRLPSESRGMRLKDAKEAARELDDGPENRGGC